MNCRYCGNELNPDARNCPHCGFDTNANDLKSILREIIRLDGEEKLLDGQGLLNLLADVAPELRKERNLLSYLVNSHGNEAILEGSKAGEDALQNAVQTTARQIAEDYSADPAKALEICEVFASALAPGWRPETDARESSPPKSPARPHNEEGDTDGNALHSRHDKALNSRDEAPVSPEADGQNTGAPRSPRVKISRPVLIAAAAVLIVLLLMVAVLPRSCGKEPTPSPPPTPSAPVPAPPSPTPAQTKTLPISGTCGDALSWTIDETGVLTISGTGPMDNYRVELAESPFTKNSEFIQSAVVEPGVTSIGAGAFFICSTMRSITLPDTLTSIGSSAFSTCEALTEIDLPGSVKEIGSSAFSYSGLHSIVIPEPVTCIKVGTFTSCKDLSSITLPIGFKEIEYFALGGCDALKDIYYPGTEQQFKDNVKINAALPDGVTIHVSNQTATSAPVSSPTPTPAPVQTKPPVSTPTPTPAPTPTPVSVLARGTCGDNCTWTLDANGVLTVSGSGAMYDYNFDTPWYERRGDIKQIVVQEGVTKIGNQAFWNCYTATKAVIPESVTEIGENALGSCYRLQDIDINSGNKAYCMVDRVLFSKDKTRLFLYLSTNTASRYEVPGSVTEIEAYAFESAVVSSVTLPSGLKKIGKDAFSDCKNLTSVRIPEGVEELPFNVFGLCKNLKSIYLPKSINNINELAFQSSGITDIYYAGTHQQWEDVLHNIWWYNPSIWDLWNKTFPGITVHYNSW